MADNHAVVVAGRRIQAVVPFDELDSSIGRIDLTGRLLAPGFLDLQVNGGGGQLFSNSPDTDTLRLICRAHRKSGTTALLPTLISGNVKAMQTAIAAVHSAMESQIPGVVGIHLEGPYISVHRRGIHQERHILPIETDALDLMSSLTVGTTLVTLAPECAPLGAIARLVGSNTLVAIGHSDATYEQALAALEEGACGFTHLFNGMAPLQSRHPGCLGAGLNDERSWIGIIADGHHVHPANLRIALSTKPKGKVILVSDATAAAQCEISEFAWNGQTIYVKDGLCVLADGTLAGSTTTLLDAVSYLVKQLDLPLEEALRMASTYPAIAIGRSDEFGYIRRGNAANLVLLDETLDVVETWVDGIRYTFSEKNGCSDDEQKI